MKIAQNETLGDKPNVSKLRCFPVSQNVKKYISRTFFSRFFGKLIIKNVQNELIYKKIEFI